VVDGYHFGADYQAALKRAGLKVLFIDDNSHAGHYSADLVLNQNVHAKESLYPSREPYTRLLLGPRYVLLRREFARWRGWKREIPSLGCKILITMGGSDPDNVSAKSIEALLQIRIEGLKAVVVAGGSNPHLESLQRLTARAQESIQLLTDPSNMPELMAWADIALIAGGGTLWELLFMGCSVLSYARDAVQAQIISQLSGEEIVGALGLPRDCTRTGTADALVALIHAQDRRARICRLARQRIDGRGAGRTLESMISAGVTRLVNVRMETIAATERDAFLAMAERLFRGLNPSFAPQPDWQACYFENILGNTGWSLRWIVVDEIRAGFVLFGLEAHRFLPRLNGMIYELYIEPEFRRKGVAQMVAREAIRELQSKSPTKIQLEVTEGNHAAAALWKSLGFRRVSERYVLAESKD
jgi:spore coat polysaccharide biosynthesis predicted glycosyltransferase SpsG/ribosomal protein S18 acetylase RimI-like enzyme